MLVAYLKRCVSVPWYQVTDLHHIFLIIIYLLIISLLFLFGAHLWYSGHSQFGIRPISLFPSLGWFTSSTLYFMCQVLFRISTFKLCCIDMQSFDLFPSCGNFSSHKAFHINVLFFFSYPVLCPVAVCCPWLLSCCSLQCAVFLDENSFCFLLCCFLTTSFLLYSPGFSLAFFCFLSG